ncbi:DUF1501 domain-containing protein [Vibrio neptunius]
MKRRQFIKMSASSLAATTITSMTSLLSALPAQAKVNDYKAMVCVFLYGGMDNHDTIIPYDNASYARWADIRKDMVEAYPVPRRKENLLKINSSGRFGPRQFALPPEMKNIHALYQKGNAAIIGNVGPLHVPTNAEQYKRGSVSLPSRLFSHNDQQSTWMSGDTEGAQFGWAGRIHDKLLEQGTSQSNPFSTITLSNGELLISGKKTAPYHLIDGRAPDITLTTPGVTGQPDSESTYKGDITSSVDGLPSDLKTYFSNDRQAIYSKPFERDLASKQAKSYSYNSHFNRVASDKVSVQFPNTHIGNQLKGVFSTILAQKQLGPNRQSFVVSMGGFDTHSGQPESLSKLQTQLDEAIGAFYNALENHSLANQVVSFTASEFGRTLACNGDGTDHGWGAHHFVIGESVRGGQIYGDLPKADFGHEYDAGNGRLIPTTSIDQYAANFASWMGLEEKEIRKLFVNLDSLGVRPVFLV